MKTIIEFNEHNVIQGSPEWFDLRLGRLTGSNFPDLMPSENARKPWTDTQIAVLLKVAAERLTGVRPEGFTSKAMEWGIQQEPFAREELSKYLGLQVSDCGFFTRSDLPICGDSPDGIAGDMEAVAELKCPESHTHVSYLIDPSKLWAKYRWQITGHCLFTGIGTGYLCSYDPRFPPSKRLVVCEPPENFSDDIERLRLRLVESCSMIEEWIS